MAGPFPCDRSRVVRTATTRGRRRRATRALAGLLLFAVVNLPRTGTADQDTGWQWRTIETDNFRIHFYEGLEGAAHRIAALAEFTHSRLAPEIGWDPPQVTHVVLMDDRDFSQGITYVGPHNLIRLWVTAPEDMSALQDYDDWLALLFVHEYTHLLHLDQARGLPAVVNAIIGDQYHPIQLNPSWLIEGYAIHMESDLTTSGRVRSTMFDMHLRMAVLEGTFLRLDQVTNNTRFFPQGNVPYLYGQDFVEYLVERFGHDQMGQLSMEMSNDIVPYGLNRTFRRVFGATVVELWEDWRDSLARGYEGVAHTIAEAGVTPSRELTAWGELMGSPRFDAQGRRILMYHTGEDHPPSLWAVDSATGEQRRLAPAPGKLALSPSPEGRFLYLARAEQHDVAYRYFDVFRLDFETGRETRLTEGLRIFGLDVSPDGRRVAYTAYRSDSSDLWLGNRELGNRRILVSSRQGDQFYSPRFSPDGQLIAVSRWRRGGYRDIVLVETETGEARLLTNDRAIDSGPCFSPDGRWVVFASDRTGISNLFAHDLEEDRLWQVTNVIGGAFAPDIAPQGDQLAFINFTSRGFDLHVMPFDPENFREPQETLIRESRTIPAPLPRHQVRDYRPWPSLAPRSWTIGAGQDAFGQAIQLGVMGNDATNAHSYEGTLTIGLERGDVGYSLGYALKMFRPDILFHHARWVTPRSDFQVDTRGQSYVQENLQASLDVSVGLSQGLARHRLALGYVLQHSRSLTDLLEQRWDPNGRPPRFPELGLRSSLRVSWTYSNTQASVRAISREKGRGLSASLSLAHASLGSDHFNVALRYRWSEFILLPWLRHHVLALSLGGGIARGDLGGASFFIGGYGEQDLLDGVVKQASIGGHHLRGYPPGIVGGQQYHLLNMEYRFPLWNAERGIYTLPIYVSHIWAAALCDVGGAFYENLDVDELRVGVGGEILMRFILGYYMSMTLRLSYAYGFMEDGGHHVEFHFGVPF